MAPLRVARTCAWLAIAGVVIAAAEPSIQPAPRQRVGILELVVDRSGSTSANDLAPTRLGAIQQATLALLDRVPERTRVGLVAFSDKAATLVRPTTDRDAVRDGLASLRPDGGTAVGDALRRALDDIRAARPAAPAAVLLLSDGASSTGSYPPDAAREAAARHVPVFTVAVGTPNGFLSRLDRTSQLRRFYVPPDLALLAGIAGPSGGRAVEARSVPALHAALDDLGRDVGVAGEPREVTMLAAAAALLLLAVAGAVSSRRRAAAAARTGPLAAARRLAPSVALLAAAGGAAVAWAQLPPAGPPAAGTAVSVARAALSRPPPPPEFVAITATTGRDRTLVRQAVALLRRHRELAAQRRAEIGRQHLTPVAGLGVTACDVCTAGPLALSSTTSAAGVGDPVCDATLGMPVIRRQARGWRVPITELVAMTVLHEQELCLHGDGSSASTVDAEQRFARKLRNGRIFDRFHVQIDAHARDRATVERAVAIARDHGELAAQRRHGLRRRGLNVVDPLRLVMCRGCDERSFGAHTTEDTDSTVACDVRLGMSRIESDARNWDLPEAEVLAVLLVHEQEHCVRHPDDRETPALDQEVRLARKLGSARLLEYVRASYRDLDATGYWKM